MGTRFRYLHLSTLPRLHHVVWCRLPKDGDDLEPGDTVRPAIVRGTKRDAANGRGAVLVSYGTTVLDTLHRSTVDLIIQNAARLSDLDLPQAVRFDLDRSNWLPWSSEFFSPPQHSLYIVAGSLSENEKTRLRRCLQNRGIVIAL